ncbi:MAG: hypothetical protein ACOYMU_02955 [Phycisphaerales bacterium]
MTTYPTNRDEILELAQLEVLGALESAECARLERLFRDASPQVQREVIDVQEFMTMQSALLPAIEPERSLRLRVLASVAQAVEENDSELVPLAKIGKKKMQGNSSVYSSSSDEMAGGESFASAAIAHARGPSRANQMRVAEDTHWRRSALVWRAACISVLSALIAVSAFEISNSRQSARISELALQNATSDELMHSIGPGIKEFLDKRCVVKGLVGATVLVNGAAIVSLSPTLDSVFVMWFDLPTTQKLSLQLWDADSGTVIDTESFYVRDRLGGTRINLKPGIATPNSDWRITDERGMVLFSSNPQ